MKNIFLCLAFLVFLISCSKDGANVNSNDNTTGTGGSLAKYTIVGNYLYAVDGSNRSNLQIFDISNPSSIVFKSKVYVGMDVETLYPYNGKLFLASNTGMYIYSISNPISPVQESYVQHFTGCDPVVVSGNYAYLTIHGGTSCRSNNINELQVYDVTNISYPYLVKRVPLDNPFGLGIKGDVLYVCDNNAGLRSFDISTPENPVSIGVDATETFIDVIPLDSIMICMLDKGVAFYDISNPAQISKLSTMKN